MKVIVMGAGVVGVSTAWFLAKAGHDVTVIDRRPAAALETSFANGSQLSVSQSEPWANPRAPMKVLKWLLKEDAPLLFKLRLDPRQWSWGLRFLWECRASRTQHNILQMLNLGLYSRAALHDIRAETGIQYDQLQRGIVCIYDDQAEFDAAVDTALFMQHYGVNRRLVTASELIEIEPALTAMGSKLVGGTFCEEDESGDARMFTQKLAALAQEKGVRFVWNTRINSLLRGDGALSGISITNAEGFFETMTADAYVLALGSESPNLTAPLGLNLPIYPAKGYSATLDILDPALAPTVSITDEAHKIVFSRLGSRLRIAGTAELNGYSTVLNPVRCDALIRRARHLFPGVAAYDSPQFWTGLRPATPSNVPCIGRAQGWRNLFLNTGHGTLGWTEGPGSGRALADIVSNRIPELDFAFTGL